MIRRHYSALTRNLTVSGRAASDGLALVNAFRRIKNVSVKRCIVHLVEELTDDE